MNAPSPTIRHEYRNCRYGELHLRYLGARGRDAHPPMLCLHPAPFSGAWFTTVMPLLNGGRMVIAPDYPGYGGSAPPEAEPSIEDYAHSMIDLLDDMSIVTADVVGFHTGCLVGAEMALLNADRVRRLILVDAPVFNAEERRALYVEAVSPRRFDTNTAGLTEEWDRNVLQKLGAMPYTRAFDLFVESLRAGHRSHWAFHAAFTYASEERLPELQKRVCVIATRSGLLHATRAAAALMPHATLTERLDITRAVFEEGAETISKDILASLES